MKRNIRRLLIVSTLVVVSVAVSQANAVIVSVSGPVSTAGSTAPAIIAAPSDALNDFVTNTGMQGFDEAQGVLTTVAFDIDGGSIAVGTLVNSHMIFLNAPSGGGTYTIMMCGGPFRDPS